MCQIIDTPCIFLQNTFLCQLNQHNSCMLFYIYTSYCPAKTACRELPQVLNCRIVPQLDDRFIEAEEVGLEEVASAPRRSGRAPKGKKVYFLAIYYIYIAPKLFLYCFKCAKPTNK